MLPSKIDNKKIRCLAVQECAADAPLINQLFSKCMCGGPKAFLVYYHLSKKLVCKMFSVCVLRSYYH